MDPSLMERHVDRSHCQNFWPIPASFFVLFVTLQFKFRVKKRSVDDVLGIRTWGRRMVGADGSTELWWPAKAIVNHPVWPNCSLAWKCGFLYNYQTYPYHQSYPLWWDNGSVLNRNYFSGQHKVRSIRIMVCFGQPKTKACCGRGSDIDIYC